MIANIRNHWLALIVALALALGVTFSIVLSRHDSLPFSQTADTLPIAGNPTEVSSDQTEWIFRHFVDESNALDKAEWNAARVDHRSVAYQIAACQEINDRDTMPRQIFTALLMDLRPDGSHAFATAKGNETYKKLIGAQDAKIALNSPEQSILAFSDAVSRTRMMAAAEAEKNLPWIQWLGIAALIISGLTTLALTIQAKLSGQVQTAAAKATAAPSPGTQPSPGGATGAGAGGAAVASGAAAPGASASQASTRTELVHEVFVYTAIVLSVVATALTGLKQIFDPTRAYTQTETALMHLQLLHQQIPSAIVCNDKHADLPEKFQEWNNQLSTEREKISPAYLPNGYTPKQ
jgi:hypothetical protein